MGSTKAYKLVETLQNKGHDILLTGGLAMEAWSKNTFRSGDWDIVGGPYVDFDAVIQSLQDLGYEKRGNSWYLVDGNAPPRNKGEFLMTQYPWGKTVETTYVLSHAVKEPKPSFTIDCVCPEWLFIDRVKKARAGQVLYAEQALYLIEQFKKNSSYDWDNSLEDRIAADRSIPEVSRNEEWLFQAAGQSQNKPRQNDEPNVDVDETNKHGP